MNKGSFFLKCAVAGLAGLLVLAFVSMVLWNWLVPSVFNGPTLNYLQMLGLLVLTRILTWQFMRYPRSGRYEPYWKQRFREKISSLDPSEREAFKQRMKEKWCSWEQKSKEEKSSNV